MTPFLSVSIDDSYLTKRLSELELLPQHIKFTLSNGENDSFFKADQEGNIVINFFNLQGNHYLWKKQGTKFPRHFTRTRLRRPVEDRKYIQEKGSPQFPFFTPSIINKFQIADHIETLHIVEGEFKAFKGYLQGLDIIGIPSIHGFYSSELKGKLHEDIEAVIVTCKVKNVVFIADADVLTTHWAEGKDLSKRAVSFYAAVKNFRESLQLLIGNPLQLIVFTHILSRFEKVGAKGLDDLFCTHTAVTDCILADLKRHHLATDYFRGFILNDVNTDLKKVFKYLGLNSPGEFYETYQEHIEDRQFVYRGKNYKWDAENSSLEENKSEIPYLRVGVKYYKKIYTPLADGETLLNLKEWTRTCIEMDHGRDYVKNIERFEDWCYVPDHIEYKPSVNGFYNRYQPLKYLPAPGTCNSSLSFIKHIFGEQYEKGLDYLQLLYTRPRQILPVLCLVSEERSTGKTTFLNWLTSIFGRNATINRNEDFESQFNSGWAGKLIIAVDETFIDRKKVYERLKSLSTGKTMKVEAKGQDSVDAEFFGKLILCSNNEDGFIPVDQSEIRFWIRKLTPYLTEDPHMLYRSLTPEIPAFLQFLLDRQLSTEQKTRMWFTKDDIQTNALTHIVSKNKSYLEKELTELLTEAIADNDLDEIQYTLGDLQAMLLKAGIRDPLFKLKELIVKKWKVDCRNSTYVKYSLTEGGDRNVFTTKGKYYTFTRSLFDLPAREVNAMPISAEKKISNPVLEFNENTVDRLTNDDLPF